MKGGDRLGNPSRCTTNIATPGHDPVERSALGLANDKGAMLVDVLYRGINIVSSQILAACPGEVFRQFPCALPHPVPVDFH